MSSIKCNTPKYRREYARFRRHINYYLREALQSNPDALYTEKQIIDLLFEQSGIKVTSGKVLNEMQKLAEQYGEAPLEPFYRVNLDFFEKHPPKPPKHYCRESDEKI